MSTNVAEHFGSPAQIKNKSLDKEYGTIKNIEKIHDIMMKDRRLEVPNIIKTTAISNEQLHHILYEYLHL